MLLKLYRRGSARCCGLLAALLMVLVCLYYISLANQTATTSQPLASVYSARKFQNNMANKKIIPPENVFHAADDGGWLQCPKILNSKSDINTVDEYKNFDFQPPWMRTKEYWDKSFEDRYEIMKADSKRPTLKVILVPHSHNDPGWLKTFTHYFQSDTRNILNTLVTKMHQHRNMSFIWSEISFLQTWWDQAHPTKQKAFKKHVQSGRLEITTGGWVMTDEANVHVFAMLDQMIEGHQWVKSHLNVTPVSGWSIDPFGHGSTLPYILANSGIQGTIIQRIHYAWKQWLAANQYGDFHWVPGWQNQLRGQHKKESAVLQGNDNMLHDHDNILREKREGTDEREAGVAAEAGERVKRSVSHNSNSMLTKESAVLQGNDNMLHDLDNILREKREERDASVAAEAGERVKRSVSHNPNSMLTHNMPFDIYSIKHSCGPHPFVCLNFDFRKVSGEYTEYSIKAQQIESKNIQAKSELLLEQYSRTGSLYPHNVALIPIGDDFRYNHEIEFDQQYTNYKLLADYINDNFDKYNADVQFGTPRDYFAEITRRFSSFPTLTGDFFVYSDIFTEGRPAYWSGYYTTRPFMKLLDRDLEHNLRNAEILFAYSVNRARQKGFNEVLRLLEKHYEQIVLARRNLGLFQHHDAITGTSKAVVMRDYGLKLFESIQDTIKIQQYAIETLIVKSKHTEKFQNFVLNDMERESYEKLPRKVPIVMNKSQREIILFNSLAQERSEVVQIRTNTTSVSVLDGTFTEVKIQINPIWNVTNIANGKLDITDREFEIMFIAVLPPLSMSTYYLIENKDRGKDKLALVYCNECSKDKKEKAVFEVRNTQPGDIQLENHNLKLLFDGQTGFLKIVTKKYISKVIQCAVKFAAYHSAQFHSGAYLFKPDPNTRDPEKEVLTPYAANLKIIITSGPIASEVTAIYGQFLSHSVRIYNSKNTSLSEAIYIENDVDFETPPKNRETELFMRFQTDIENGEPPVFYSDSNGFQYQKRVKVPDIGIEGNYFPITTMAFIQDSNLRLSLVTNHAQGASSFEPGYLEVMLDRRTLYDDSRGMGEGLVDSKFTTFRFWLVLETVGDTAARSKRHKRDAVAPVSFVSRPKRELYDNDYENARVRKLNIPPKPKLSDIEYQLPSIFVNYLSNSLNYPVNIFTIETSDDTNIKIKPFTSLISHPFPCDLHLMNLRTITDDNFPQFPSNGAFLILQRQGYSCSIGKEIPNACNSMKGLKPGTRFESLIVDSMTRTTLTGLKDLYSIDSLEQIKIEAMDLQTVRVIFKK